MHGILTGKPVLFIHAKNLAESIVYFLMIASNFIMCDLILVESQLLLIF
jgi:hypothetical protein